MQIGILTRYSLLVTMLGENKHLSIGCDLAYIISLLARYKRDVRAYEGSQEWACLSFLLKHQLSRPGGLEMVEYKKGTN